MQERLRAEEQRHRSELESAEASKAQKERLEAELKGAEGSCFFLHFEHLQGLIDGGCLFIKSDGSCNISRGFCCCFLE